MKPILSALLAALVAGSTVTVCTAAPRREIASRADVAWLIHQEAERWHQDEAQLLRLAYCESKLDPLAYNAASDAAGVFQWTGVSWREITDRYAYWWGTDDLTSFSRFDAQANVRMTVYALANGQAWRWRACL